MINYLVNNIKYKLSIYLILHIKCIKNWLTQFLKKVFKLTFFVVTQINAYILGEKIKFL